ncbi:MAG: hypothetical protein AAGI11_14195 [Pseudomonadota bacterium]
MRQKNENDLDQGQHRSGTNFGPKTISSKKALSLAVASASVAVTLNANAAILTVTDGGDSGPNTLRQAIADAGSGDMITINTDAVSVIELDTQLFIEDKSLIIAAPVDETGAPQVTIQPSGSAGDIRLLATDNTDLGAGELNLILSGLRLTGGSPTRAGGAIFVQASNLVLDKSVVTGNTAVGLGGGILGFKSEVCLQGSEVSNNTVSEDVFDDTYYAMGGGIAVRGVVSVLPSTAPDSDSEFDIAGCLTSQAADSLFDAVSPAFASYAADLAGNPDGIDIIPSKVTMNSVSVQEAGSLASEKYAFAFGGGMAVLRDGFGEGAIYESKLLGDDCIALGGGDDGQQCTAIISSEISGNSATINLSSGGGEPKYSIASGGGIFVGAQGTELAHLVTIKYSTVSTNSIAIQGASASGANVAIGAGVGALNSPLIYNETDFWEGEFEPSDAECPDSGKYCGNSVTLAASVIASNTATLASEPLPAEDSTGPTLSLISGGGIGAIDLFDASVEIDKYAAAPQVLSFFSTVSGNTLDADIEDNLFKASGGGIAVGSTYSDGPGGLLVEDFGKYLGLQSGISGNQILISGEETEETYGIASGGGLSSPNAIIIGQKPEFAVIDENAEPDIKYAGAITGDVLFTAPGGIKNNTIDLSDTTTGYDLNAVVVGGGLGSTANYSLQTGLGTSISGNTLNVDVSPGAGDSELVAVGGGIGARPLVVGEATVLSAWKYSAITDNTISVSGAGNLETVAIGGGIGLDVDPSRFEEIDLDPSDEPYSNPSVVYSEVSGNAITLSSVTADSQLAGGGLGATDVAANSDNSDNSDNSKYGGPHILNSTIAENSLSITGLSGTSLGGGVFLEVVKYGGEQDIGGIIHATIADNTSSNNGSPDGGQLALDLADTSDGGYRIFNTLITGDTAQGTKDAYYDKEDTNPQSSVIFHGDDAPDAGLLDPTLADPTLLGDLQFNGGSFGGGEKYSGFAAPATIALLPGSGAIDPSPINSTLCAAFEVDSVYDDDYGSSDQRGYSRIDGCPDLGAYERMAENDGDNFVDDAELTAPGTVPDILAQSGENPPQRYGIVLESGDGNSDGRPDVDQANVASFVSDIVGAVTLATIRTDEEPYPVTNIQSVPGMMAGGLDLSLGGVSFTVGTGDDTQTVQMQLIAPDLPGIPLSLAKQVCNPAPANPDEGWEILAQAEPFGDGRVQFLFELEPGGPFDCNGDADDIEDPVFIAREGAPESIPTLPAIAYGLLTGAIGLLGMFGLRSRKKKLPR